MKKLILLTMLGFASAIATTAQAQVSINVSIGAEPGWAPARYDYVEYVPVRRYVPVREYHRPVPVYYSSPRHYNHYRGQKVKYVKYYNAPRNHKKHHQHSGKKYKTDHRQERRDGGTARIIRPRG